MYRLASKSKLPNARAFEAWIFEELVPTVLKTGEYVAPGLKLARIIPMAVPADWPELAALVAEYDLRLHRVNTPHGFVALGATCGAHRYYVAGLNRGGALAELREHLDAGDSVEVLRAAHRLHHARREAARASEQRRCRVMAGASAAP